MQSRMRFRRDGWDTGCWGFHPDVIGGGNGVSVVSREASQGGDRVIGIDTRSGRTLWERAIATRGYGAGASPDGELCWVIGHRDESAADAMELRAFACRTGRARFSVPDVEVAAWSATAPAGLFVAGAREAALVDPQRGRPRWRRAIQSGEVALVAGARVHEESPAYASSDRERTLLVLSPSDGNVVIRVPLPAHEGVIGRADGTLIVGESAEIDAAGARHTRTPSRRVLEVVRGGGTSPATVFLTRPSRRAILRFPSDAWSLGAHHEGGSTYDAVYVWSTTGIGAVRVFVVADVPPSVSP